MGSGLGVAYQSCASVISHRIRMRKGRGEKRGKMGSVNTFDTTHRLLNERKPEGDVPGWEGLRFQYLEWKPWCLG